MKYIRRKRNIVLQARSTTEIAKVQPRFLPIRTNTRIYSIFSHVFFQGGETTKKFEKVARAVHDFSRKSSCHIEKLGLVCYNNVVTIVFQNCSYNGGRMERFDRSLVWIRVSIVESLFHGLPLKQQFDCSRLVKRVQSNFQQAGRIAIAYPICWIRNWKDGNYKSFSRGGSQLFRPVT